MSNHLIEAPADLRIIQRKYARAIEVPATESPSMALQNYNTSKLQDGALAVVYASGAYGTESGQPKMFVFRRNYTGAAFTNSDSFTPSAGPGYWAQYDLGTVYSMQALESGGAVTLTAGAGDQTLVEPIQSTWNNAYTGIARVEARVLVTTTTAGAVVTLTLEGDSYDTTGVPTYATLATDTFTSITNQQTQLTLVGFLTIENPFYRFRVRGNSVTQTAAVTHTYVDKIISRTMRGFIP